MSNRVKEFMSTMGTGPKSSDPLTYDQAYEAMESIVNGDVEPATFGAFMVAERWKGQSPEELAGFLDALRDRNEAFNDLSEDVQLDIAGRFDGKAHTINTDLPSSIIAASNDLTIFTHSGRNVPTQQESTFIDVVDELGWDPAPSMSRVKKSVEQIGFGYAQQRTYAPHLASLRSLRADLGVRCFLNTIESMMNPTNARRHVGSFYHLSYAKRVCDTFVESQTIDLDEAYMLQGIEGQTEFRPGVSMLGILNGDAFDDREIDTGELGLNFDRDQLEERGASPDVSAEIMVKFLTGNSVPEAYASSVLLNSALKLWAGNRVNTLEDGIALARESIESGQAHKYFEQLEEAFQRGRKQSPV